MPRTREGPLLIWSIRSSNFKVKVLVCILLLQWCLFHSDSSSFDGELIYQILTVSLSYPKVRTIRESELYLLRQKGGDVTQSYDKSPYTHGNVKRAK